jgi:excisionase family DNA binding protein
LLAAIRRGEARRDEILKAQDLLSTKEMAARLGVSIGTVRRWRRENRLLGLTGRGRGYSYPAWQLVDGQPIPRLAAIGGYFNFDPWATSLFLAEPLDALDGKSPLSEVLAGRSDLIIGMASGIAEGGIL